MGMRTWSSAIVGQLSPSFGYCCAGGRAVSPVFVLAGTPVLSRHSCVGHMNDIN